MITKTLNDYFCKIGFEKEARPDLETLKELQEKHLNCFPFENLNSFIHLPVLLDASSLHQKFLNQQRGGYCFEQNLFFMEVLQAIGFIVRPILARVFNNDSRLGRTHQILLVDIDGVFYVSDTGYGGMGSPHPLLLNSTKSQETYLNNYRIEKKEFVYHLNILIAEDWREMYSFDLVEYLYPDIIIANWYISTHCDSHFTNDLTLAKIDGTKRYGLKNNILSIYCKGELIEKIVLKNTSEIMETIKSYFKISFEGLPGLKERLQDIIN
ncbi:MAG TPA: arylamine N-acetyltransferase [Edaphocola sp.]|nr:arylamine N-acetyltransferase [Edaphocola sp.]